jgi:hypothetical protein
VPADRDYGEQCGVAAILGAATVGRSSAASCHHESAAKSDQTKSIDQKRLHNHSFSNTRGTLMVNGQGKANAKLNTVSRI